MRRHTVVLGTVVCSLLMCANLVSASNYSITDLGAMLRPVEINSSGHVTGFSITEPRQAFRWQNGTKTDLDNIGGVEGVSRDINDSGQIVGYVKMPDGKEHAVLWEQDRTTDLGANDILLAINNSGQMAGWKENSAQPLSSVTTNIGSLGGAMTVVFDVNSSKQIVGSSDTQNGLSYADGKWLSYKHAFLWQNGKITDLGTLGGRQSSASCINNIGNIVGTSEISDNISHAFLYQNGRMTDLGTLEGNSSAQGINNANQIVGSSITGEKKRRRAVIWNGGSITDLNTCIPADSMWTLNQATAINDAGQIVGLGIYKGELHGFLLTPSN